MTISLYKKKRKNNSFNLNTDQKLAIGTRLRVAFLEDQYYLGTVISSVVRNKPWFKVHFDDGEILSFSYPISKEIEIISEAKLSRKSPKNRTSGPTFNDSYTSSETDYSQARIRIGKEYQATIPDFIEPVTQIISSKLEWDRIIRNIHYVNVILSQNSIF